MKAEPKLRGGIDRPGFARNNAAMKILLVEDNARVSQFVCKGLEEAGHTVDHAENGREGLFLATPEHYDAVILDRMLPGGVDGQIGRASGSDRVCRYV